MTHLTFSPTLRSLVIKVLGMMKKDTIASTGEFKILDCLIFNPRIYFREVFNKIAAEEIELFREEESDNEFEIPEFGTSTSSYDDVIITHFFL
jgi:hypothetical protein